MAQRARLLPAVPVLSLRPGLRHEAVVAGALARGAREPARGRAGLAGAAASGGRGPKENPCGRTAGGPLR
eukprot:7903644-Pyramimonas_sp.AAC.1